MEYGLAAFDGDNDVSLELSSAAVKALHNYHDNIEVALVAGSLMQALSDNNMLKDRPLALESCKSTLILHGMDKRVQTLYGEVLRSYGHLHLHQQDHDVLTEELDKARIFMSPLSVEAVPVTPQQVLQCLTRVTDHAHFQIMNYGEQVEYDKQVAEFVAWCLDRSLREDCGASFYGDLHVARAAGVLLYKTAAGCMQLDGEYLVEAQRRSLCDLELPPLFYELRQRLYEEGGSPDDAHIDWLYERLLRSPLHRALAEKRPAADAAPDAPGAKRGRAGGSA